MSVAQEMDFLKKVFSKDEDTSIVPVDIHNQIELKELEEIAIKVHNNEIVSYQDLVEYLNGDEAKALSILDNEKYYNTLYGYKRAVNRNKFTTEAFTRLWEIVNDKGDNKTAITALKEIRELVEIGPKKEKDSGRDININLSLEGLIKASEKGVKSIDIEDLDGLD